jgi:hypothetical protein
MGRRREGIRGRGHSLVGVQRYRDQRDFDGGWWRKALPHLETIFTVVRREIMRDEGSNNSELVAQAGRTLLEAIDEKRMQLQQLRVGGDERSCVGGVLDRGEALDG